MREGKADMREYTDKNAPTHPNDTPQKGRAEVIRMDCLRARAAEKAADAAAGSPELARVLERLKGQLS